MREIASLKPTKKAKMAMGNMVCTMEGKGKILIMCGGQH